MTSRQVIRRTAHNAETVIESEKKLDGKHLYPNSKYKPIDGTDKDRKKVYPRSSFREEHRNAVKQVVDGISATFKRIRLTNAGTRA
jgi:hypothetical protein